MSHLIVSKLAMSSGMHTVHEWTLRFCEKLADAVPMAGQVKS